MSASRPQNSFVRLVDWRTVIAAGVPVWALVGGLIAWQKFAPKPVAVAKPVVAKLPEILPQPRAAEPDDFEVWGPCPDVRVNPFNPPPTPEELTALKKWYEETKQRKKGKPVEIDPEVAEAFGQAAKELVRGFLTAKPAEPPVVVKAENKPVPAGCKTFDTALHFVKHYDEAKRQAARQDKLVFVLHLSGNLDDDGFT